jgi:hypothetical protein
MLVDLTKNIAYSDISNQIARQLGRIDGDVTLLAPTFGPRPCWKFPEEGARIPHNVSTLYLVDRTRPFSITLLRTDVEDQPLLVGNVNITAMKAYPNKLLEPPTGETSQTALSILQSAVNDRSLELKSAKMYESLEELNDQLYDHSTYQNLPSFPTVFYALSAQCVYLSHSNHTFSS